MVGFIKLTGKMRRIASTFVVAVVMMNLLITGALVSLQYASAIEDASSADLLCKQEETTDGQQSETLSMTEFNEEISEIETFTYDEVHNEVSSDLREVREETMMVSVSRQADLGKSREVQIMSVSTGPELNSQGGLLEINNPDPEYTNKVVSITGNNRDNLERLVMGEAGGEGFEGAALVAQAIKDTMLLEDNYDVKWIKKEYKYSASLNKEPNEDAINAVKYVFDDGGYVVKHRLIYFYAPKWVKNHWSGFHESQDFIIEWSGHKFFDLAD